MVDEVLSELADVLSGLSSMEKESTMEIFVYGDGERVFHPMVDTYLLCSALPYWEPSRPWRIYCRAAGFMRFWCLIVCLTRLLFATGPVFTDHWSCLFVVLLHAFASDQLARPTGLRKLYEGRQHLECLNSFISRIILMANYLKNDQVGIGWTINNFHDDSFQTSNQVITGASVFGHSGRNTWLRKVLRPDTASGHPPVQRFRAAPAIHEERVRARTRSAAARLLQARHGNHVGTRATATKAGASRGC